MTVRRTLPWLMAACLGLGLGARASAQLAESSPFMPPGTAGGPGAAAGGGTPELRGIMSTGDGFLYCIYEPSRKSSSWVALNEGGHDFVVKSADPARDTVTLESAGSTFTIALREAKVATLSGPALNLPNRSVGPQYPVPGMNPADAARRLNAVAAEVRRRRQLREEADRAEDRGMQPRGPPPTPQ
jgi:hypothetical protein